MGRVFRRYLDSGKIYSCGYCKTHLACHEDILSKHFQGQSGQAFLFDTAINVTVGPSEERQLRTGLHVVADIYCATCRNIIGWKYEEAYEEDQKYKEGKFIIEIAKTTKEWLS